MAAEEPQDSAGPSSPPPPLPEGWLAQWEGVSRKWYYVQRATGKSQWDIPTEPVILTPSTTPGSIGAGPTQAPHTIRAGSQSLSPQTLAADSPDLNASSRGLFSGNHSSSSTASATRPGLSGVLGSVGSSNSAISQIADRVIGRIAGKHASQSSSPAGSYGAYGSGHNTAQNQNAYGYASTGQSGAYTGNAPQYLPQGQTGSQQNDYPQHSSAGSAAYASQYHAGSHQPSPNQFPNVNSGSQQPWSSHNSFQQNQHPTYQQPEQYGHSAGDVASQPEWQASAHPPVPHSTRPGSQPTQPNSNNPAAISNNHQQPNSNYQPPLQQQIPPRPNQQ